ncbi:MAG: segregation and condensation protein [Frankiaceae bacterium]|jgi:segregation and condensation protein B|nr:segregation and condensation protein [Frankiaceae bacterium]
MTDESTPNPSVRAALEAVLLVVDEPVAEVVLAQVVERPTEEVAGLLRELAAEYDAGGRGFELRCVAGGWRLYTRADCAAYVERFVRDGQQARLTQAALETLAVVAYRQPVSRSRIAAIRGVNVDAVMRTLVGRGMVTEVGTEPATGAILYGTTSVFLERLGLSALEELPPLRDYLPDHFALDDDDVVAAG